MSNNTLLGLLGLNLLSSAALAEPPGTAFTYQGRLETAGSPATGLHDFRCALYDVPSGPTQIGGAVTNVATAVANGTFTVSLDFGAAAFPGSARWLELGVRTNGVGDFAALSPRQPFTPTPYALYAPNAGAAGSVPASGLTGTVALSQLPPTVLTNHASAVQLTGSFTGNGSGLTSLSANSLSSGTLPDARLSANVARLNADQTFSGQSSFSQNVGIGTSSPGKRLTVAGDMEVGVSPGDYHHLRLGGGNASGYLYGSFAGLGDGLSLGYNYYYDGSGAGHCDNTNGPTSRLTLGYGNVTLATGTANTAPSPRLLVNVAGNVGIGTLYPRTALEVSGTVLASDFSGSFWGNGAGLTNLSATAMTGTLPLAQLPAGVLTNNATGVTLSGTFSGSVIGLTNANADLLDGQHGAYYLNASNHTGTVTLARLPSALVTNNAIDVRITGIFSGDGSSLSNVPVSVPASTRYPWSDVIGWGWNEFGQLNIPDAVQLKTIKAVAVGANHSLALMGDGTVVGWGQTAIPAGLTNVTAIAAGYFHSLALKSDGTVIVWGTNQYGQISIPAGLTNVMAIAAGWYHSLALKADGTVVGWGYNGHGQLNIPAGLTNVEAIAGGGTHSLALRADGTVVGWGRSNEGQVNIPAGLTNVTAIAVGGWHNLALRSDGTIVAWGTNDYRQINIPAGLTNVTAIAAGWHHSLALKRDGTVVGWGRNYEGQVSIPAGLTNVLALALGPSAYHALAIYFPVLGFAFSADGIAFGNGLALTNLSAGNLAEGVVPLARLPDAVVTNYETSVTLGGTFSGNGSSLTGLNASQLASGIVPLARLPDAVVTNFETEVTLGGAFSGDGAGLLNVPLISLNTSGLLAFSVPCDFGLAASPGVGTWPLWVAAADMNGDGQPDLVSANYSANTLTVLTNNGRGGFVLASSPAVGPGPEAVAVADVNGDGRPDLISANYTANTVTLLFNNGGGVFTAVHTLTVGQGPRAVVAADLIGHGKPDLISANSGANTLTILTNNGSGTFSWYGIIPVGADPRAVVAADVNGDGKLDLISANNARTR